MENDAAYFRIFRADGQFVAATDDSLQAAMLVMVLGAGASIRDTAFRRDVLWLEGAEAQSAGDNLGYVVDTLVRRRRVRGAADSSRPPPA